MAIRSRARDGLGAIVAVTAGVPFVGTLFLGVVCYCYLEWVHDTLASMPTRPMRTVEANS